MKGGRDSLLTLEMKSTKCTRQKWNQKTKTYLNMDIKDKVKRHPFITVNFESTPHLLVVHEKTDSNEHKQQHFIIRQVVEVANNFKRKHECQPQTPLLSWRTKVDDSNHVNLCPVTFCFFSFILVWNFLS